MVTQIAIIQLERLYLTFEDMRLFNWSTVSVRQFG